jgi:CheY-like chemotaxis protein
VVDDDALNRIMLTKLLERDGYHIRTVGDGEEALAALADERFDAVLLDIVMPGLDGTQVLAAIKADDRLGEIPVVMISAIEETDCIVRCLDGGAEDFVSKPFKPEVLRAKVKGCLTRRRRAAQRPAGLRRSITTLHTLGPAGTNCENAARAWLDRRGTPGDVVLHPSFEDAAAAVVRTPGAALLSCIAYPELHTLLYSHVDSLVVVDCLIIPTHGMVLARRAGVVDIESVATHPAPASLVPGGVAVRLAPSNSQAAADCAAGLVDACITTRAAMEDHGLELARDFGALSMGFTIHARSEDADAGCGRTQPRLP